MKDVDDLISKQMAIDALMTERKNVEAYMDECLEAECFALGENAKTARDRIEEDIDILKNLPSAQKTGKWIEDDDQIIAGHCSLCGWKAIYYETDVFGMSYCPNCGARMESE